MLLLLFTHLVVVGLSNHGCPSFGYLGSRSARYHPSDLHHSFLGQFHESFPHGPISFDHAVRGLQQGTMVVLLGGRIKRR